MSPPEDLYPPVTHGPAWSVLAVGLLGLVALWWLGLWWLSRRSRTATPAWEPLRGGALETRRVLGLVAIDAVVEAHDTGQVTTRQAFQQLSPIVRRFVSDAAGIPADMMTLDDLTSEHPGPLADLVAMMYPLEFSAVVDGDVHVGAERARRLVGSWTPEASPVGGWPRSSP